MAESTRISPEVSLSDFSKASSTVLTSLPANHYSAEDIATLYQERWEIELSFRDIKSSMQHNAFTLRSKTVELVYQELWGGLLLTYNIIRCEAACAAVAFGHSPSDSRFKPACQHIAVQLIVMANINPLSEDWQAAIRA